MPTLLAVPVALILLVPGPDAVVDADSSPTITPRQDCAVCPSLPRAKDLWQRLFTAPEPPVVALRPFEALFPAALDGPTDQVAVPRPVAIEYSHGYQVRLKIHKYASYATIPLFATQLVLGQSLYSNAGDSKRAAHAAIGTAIGVLFGINTVTGVWNMWEARRDPSGHTRRLVHGLLMLAGDAGFFATAAVTPDSEHGEHGQDFSSTRSTHRALAISSIAVASAGYLTMLIGR